MTIHSFVRNSLLLFAFAMNFADVCAQSSAVKKASQGVFTLTTFNADGTLHSSTKGVFVGKADEGIAAWEPFKGARSAVVVDARGKKYDVDVMMGVSEMYNLCRFRVKGTGPIGLSFVGSDAPVTKVNLIHYDIKKPSIKSVKVMKSEKFLEHLNYYLFNDNEVSSTELGCPLVNDQGQLLGIMQRPVNGGQAFSADARLTNTFKITGLSINDPTLRATDIRTALPADEKDATLMLMVASSQVDSAKYDAYVSDFLNQFPTSAEGYNLRASRLMNQKRMREADDVLQQGVKRASKKDEALSNYAKLVYQYSVYPMDSTFTAWNFSKAQELAENAYKENPLPIYRHQVAQAIYAQGDYQKALDIFTQLQQTDLGKNGEVYFEAAQCKTQLKKPQAEIMELINKAVDVQPGAPSAPYLLERGRIYDQAGETRKAFEDYLRYDSIIGNRGTHQFYFLKFQNEMKLRQYQLALNDIAHAIVLNRTEPTYYAEMASLQLRVNRLEDAVKTCNIALQLTDQYSDLYIIKGISLCQLKQKEEGVKCLQRAQQLGDPRAEGLMKKYK